MKHLFLAALICCVALGQSTPQKKAAAPSKKPVVANRAPAKSRTTTTSYRRPVRHYSVQQNTPTPDRYREIQVALAAQGYLKTPSTGVWDKDSIDAMQRFQKDRNLEPTGKLTARSLAGLGLGPTTPAASQ